MKTMKPLAEVKDGSYLAKAWVICHHCGQEHIILPGETSPVYYCNLQPFILVEGDEVFIEGGRMSLRDRLNQRNKGFWLMVGGAIALIVLAAILKIITLYV